MTTDRELIEVGKTLSRSKTAHVGRVHAGLAQSYAADLARVGWTALDTNDLIKSIADLEAAVSDQAKARDEAHLSSATLDQAVIETKGFLRKIRAALPAVRRTVGKGDSVLDMFKVGAALGSSAAKLSSYLAKIRPGVEKLESQLRDLFEGVSPLPQLDVLKTKLDAAATASSVAKLRLPESTAAINKAKGLVADKLRGLNERARIVFVEHPELYKQFSLDNLASARSPSVVVGPPITPPSTP